MLPIVYENRTEIDAIDAQILDLLPRRGRLVRQAWATQAQLGLPPPDPQRETDILHKLGEIGTQLGLSRQDSERIWREVLRTTAQPDRCGFNRGDP
jgi:chorismate mutase